MKKRPDKDGQMRQALREAYKAPKPEEKQAFMKNLKEQCILPERESSGISHWQFILYQIQYIRVRNWVLAAGIFALSLYLMRTVGREEMWCISACVPFLALMVADEGSRAFRYGMEELELSSRFTRKTVLAARMGAIGLGNLLFFVVAIPTALVWRQVPVLLSGVYILLPYLLSAFLNLFIVRKMHGRETLYACMGACLLVSVGCVMFGIMQIPVWRSGSIGMEIIVFLAAAAMVVNEGRKILEQAEEMVWN